MTGPESKVSPNGRSGHEEDPRPKGLRGLGPSTIDARHTSDSVQPIPAGNETPQQPLIDERFSRFITRFGPYITVFGLVFSLWQASKSAQSQASLNILASTISTKYVGTFPEELPEITALIERTQKTLCIVTDFVTYGNWSDPAGFERYKAALLSTKQRKVDVTMVVYNPATLPGQIEKQLGKDDDVGAFKALENSPHWKSFFEFYHLPEPQNMKEFQDYWLGEQRKLGDELRKMQVKVVPRTAPFPTFFWLRDDQEAIFVFNWVHADDTNAQTVAFRTVDPKILDMMRNLYKGFHPPDQHEN